eukprot:8139918-Ditylum_brightwellii.AAC.1
MATTLGLHAPHATHAFTFNVMRIAFHSNNINSMASRISPWHVPHLPATEGDLALSVTMMWDSTLRQNTQIIMKERKQ